MKILSLVHKVFRASQGKVFGMALGGGRTGFVPQRIKNTKPKGKVIEI